MTFLALVRSRTSIHNSAHASPYTSRSCCCRPPTRRSSTKLWCARGTRSGCSDRGCKVSWFIAHCRHCFRYEYAVVSQFPSATFGFAGGRFGVTRDKWAAVGQSHSMKKMWHHEQHQWTHSKHHARPATRTSWIPVCPLAPDLRRFPLFRLAHPIRSDDPGNNILHIYHCPRRHFWSTNWSSITAWCVSISYKLPSPVVDDKNRFHNACQVRCSRRRDAVSPCVVVPPRHTGTVHNFFTKFGSTRWAWHACFSAQM